MIFAVLEDWYHHIVLTHSCKLVSFLHTHTHTHTHTHIYIYLLFYCQKSKIEPGACTKRYSRARIFTFYFSKAEQYTFGRVQNVGCSGVFKGEGHGAMPPFGPTTKIFYRRLYMKRCVFCHFPAIVAKFNNVWWFFSYRYNVRLKSPCEIAHTPNAFENQQYKPYRPIIFRGGLV